ncbi:MAG TPA: SRPBCC family protein [Candidatus Absconditabacterales bacterium]|nr:SRPBCC family protein [Candidatus Absconditabacterales bacterium]HMT26862.1 SRPBCC family protein [Candidatus Absconditabacterales bacterium]
MKILYALLILIAIPLIVAAALPKTFSLSVETVINVPKPTAREYIKLIKNQETYSVRIMKDPNIKLVYSGIDGTEGFTASRSSDDQSVGVGAQEITKIVDGDSYEVELRFEKPMKNTNYATTTLEALDISQTKVTSSFRGESARPFNLLTYCFLPMVRKDMEQNLANLKKNLETK